MLCLSGFKLYSRWVPLKGVQFPGRDALIKLIEAANLQSPVITQKCLP